MLIHANFLHRNQKILLLQLISDYSNFLKKPGVPQDVNNDELYDLISRKKIAIIMKQKQNSTKK